MALRVQSSHVSSEGGEVKALKGIGVPFRIAQARAEEHAGKIVTLSELIKSVANVDCDISKHLRGSWVWVSDDLVLETAGPHKVDYEKGKLIPVGQEEYDALPASEMAIVMPGRGKGPIAVYINMVDNRGEKRFNVSSDYSPRNGAMVVISEKETEVSPDKITVHGLTKEQFAAARTAVLGGLMRGNRGMSQDQVAAIEALFRARVE